MSGWVDDKIKEWKEWKGIPNRVSIIPPSIQVGKVLEFTCGNIDRALDMVRRNGVFDAEIESFANDTYWYQVERVILENIVHEAIISE